MLLVSGVSWWGEARAKSLLCCCPRIIGVSEGGMGREMQWQWVDKLWSQDRPPQWMVQPTVVMHNKVEDQENIEHVVGPCAPITP